MVGRPEDGPGIEGAPLALLERVTAFLAQERAKLRTELNSANTGDGPIGLPPPATWHAASYSSQARAVLWLRCWELSPSCTFLIRALCCNAEQDL